MNLIKIASLAVLMSTAPARAASCIAACELNSGQTVFTIESYDMVGRGAEIDDALQDLVTKCGQKAVERGAFTVKIKTDRRLREGNFDVKVSCFKLDAASR